MFKVTLAKVIEVIYLEPYRTKLKIIPLKKEIKLHSMDTKMTYTYFEWKNEQWHRFRFPGNSLVLIKSTWRNLLINANKGKRKFLECLDKTLFIHQYFFFLSQFLCICNYNARGQAYQSEFLFNRESLTKKRLQYQ